MHVMDAQLPVETYAQLPGDRHQEAICMHPCGWVDDWVFMADAREHLKLQLNVFAAAAKKCGLTLALDKFQMLANKHSPSNVFMHGSQSIRATDSIVFVGAHIQADGQADAMINNRIAAANGKRHSVIKRLRLQRPPTALIHQFHAIYHTPALLWSLEAYSINQRQHRQLHTASNLPLRRYVARRPNSSSKDHALNIQATLKYWRFTGRVKAYMLPLAKARIRLNAKLGSLTKRILAYRDKAWQDAWGTTRSRPRRATVAHKHLLVDIRPRCGESACALALRELRLAC